jgi:hypothetical protein
MLVWAVPQLPPLSAGLAAGWLPLAVPIPDATVASLSCPLRVDNSRTAALGSAISHPPVLHDASANQSDGNMMKEAE